MCLVIAEALAQYKQGNGVATRPISDGKYKVSNRNGIDRPVLTFERDVRYIATVLYWNFTATVKQLLNNNIYD